MTVLAGIKTKPEIARANLTLPPTTPNFTICTSIYSYWKSDLNGKNKMGKFRVDTLGKIASVGRGVYLRTGSWDPSTNLNGFLGTRGTRSNEGPVNIQCLFILNHQLNYSRLRICLC